MCEHCQRHEKRMHWLALLLRRIGLLIVTEVEREYGMEPSILTKQERERRAREKAA